MAKSQPTNEITPGSAGQIAIMHALSQQAAAWALDCSSRSLRDTPTAPRNADGSYDAQAVFRWQAGRAKCVDLGDEAHEQLLVVADELYGSSSMGRIVDILRKLHRTHGDSAMATFVQIILDRWGELVDKNPADYPAWATPLSSLAIRDAENNRRQQEAHELARINLEIATVCEDCDRLRRGPQWIKAKPPSGYVVIKDRCPACAALP